jgi:PKD repeat protein
MTRALCVRLIVAAALFPACTVHKTDVPPVTGPSEYATSISMTATPDSIAQNGVAQSAVLVTVRNSTGGPLAGLGVQLTILVDGNPSDFGTLSAYTVYTGADGMARAIYTAPVASPFLAGGPSKMVSIVATPIGSNQATASSRTTSIAVTPPPAMPVQFGAPSASVTYSPTGPKVGDVVRFDGSESDSSSGHIVTYVWDFGDGKFNEEHGSDASHVYSAAGTYTMVLGVIDDSGRIGSSIKTIVVTN